MTLRLLLIRHGRSAHIHRGGLLDRRGFEAWRAAYDAAGIAETDAPPPRLVEEVGRASEIVSSDLPRAFASASLLARGRPVTISPLFHEAPLPIPGWMPSPAPLTLWDAAVHLRWALAIARRRDEDAGALDRARDAAAWCRAACERATDEGGTVAVVTHGVFRRLLARQLVAEGWGFEPGRRGYGHWSVWRLSTASRIGRLP